MSLNFVDAIYIVRIHTYWRYSCFFNPNFTEVLNRLLHSSYILAAEKLNQKKKKFMTSFSDDV